MNRQESEESSLLDLRSGVGACPILGENRIQPILFPYLEIYNNFTSLHFTSEVRIKSKFGGLSNCGTLTVDPLF